MGLGRLRLTLRTHYSPPEMGNHTAHDSIKALCMTPDSLISQASASEIPSFLSLQHLTPARPCYPPRYLLYIRASGIAQCQSTLTLSSSTGWLWTFGPYLGPFTFAQRYTGQSHREINSTQNRAAWGRSYGKPFLFRLRALGE
jgi:hypothetical protein